MAHPSPLVSEQQGNKLEQIPAPAALIATDGQTILDRNGRLIALCGPAAGEDSIFDLVDDVDELRFHSACQKLLASRSDRAFMNGMLRGGNQAACIVEVSIWDDAPTEALLVTIDLPRSTETGNRANGDLFEATFNTEGVGIVHASITGDWLRLNDRFCEIVGYDRAGLIGKSFADISHEEDLAQDFEVMEGLLSGQTRHVSFEKRYIRGDGAPVWVQLTVSLARSRSGTPEYFIAIIDDIMERKKAELLKDSLRDELSHRSKNLLTVIGSMLSLLAGEDAGEQALAERLRSRIKALGLANDLIVAQEWRGASLAELAEVSLAPFRASDSSRIKVSGPDLFVSADAAQSLGLAFHELATNALKYGALSDSDGQVDLNWRHVGDALEDFQLVWKEIGGPGVPPETKNGFGSVVLESVVPMGLGGRGQRSIEPGKPLVWTLSVPIERLRSKKGNLEP